MSRIEHFSQKPLPDSILVSLGVESRSGCLALCVAMLSIRDINQIGQKNLLEFKVIFDGVTAVLQDGSKPIDEEDQAGGRRGSSGRAEVRVASARASGPY